MTNIPETNLKFNFKIEIVKDSDKWIWTIYDHKNNVVAKANKSFESKEECKSDLDRIASSIKEFLST